MAFTRPTATTRIAPDEAQGHAGAPCASKGHTGQLFQAGIHAAGVPCDGNVRSGGWGDGTEKPCCSKCGN